MAAMTVPRIVLVLDLCARDNRNCLCYCYSLILVLILFPGCRWRVFRIVYSASEAANEQKLNRRGPGRLLVLIVIYAIDQAVRIFQ